MIDDPVPVALTATTPLLAVTLLVSTTLLEELTLIAPVLEPMKLMPIGLSAFSELVVMTVYFWSSV